MSKKLDILIKKLVEEIVENIMIDIEERLGVNLEDDRDYVKRIWSMITKDSIEEYLGGR